MMLAESIWKATIAVVAIVAFFGGFAFLMYQARKTHTKRIGGIHYLQVLYGRFPRWPRKRRK